MLDKAFAHRPTVIYKKKSSTHLNHKGDHLAIQHSSTVMSPGPEGALLVVASPYMSPGWLHPEYTPFSHVRSTGANNFPVLPRPTTPLH